MKAIRRVYRTEFRFTSNMKFKKTKRKGKDFGKILDRKFNVLNLNLRKGGNYDSKERI